MDPHTKTHYYLYENIKEFYEVINLTENFQNIPDNIDQLLVIHPKNLSDNALYQIDQFVLKGKGAIFLLIHFQSMKK